MTASSPALNSSLSPQTHKNHAVWLQFFKSIPPLFRSQCTMTPTVYDETFSSLLSPSFAVSTDAFLDVYHQGITSCKECDHIPALTRFAIKTITGNKFTGTTSEHELLSVVVNDKDTDQNYTFFIEQNSSSDSTNGTPKMQVKLSTGSTSIPTTHPLPPHSSQLAKLSQGCNSQCQVLIAT